MGSDPLLQLWRISLDPAEKGRVVHRDTAVLQHQLEITVADREHQVPAHGPQDHLGRELPPLKLFALRHTTRVATCLVETARLSNPDPPHKLATDPGDALVVVKLDRLGRSTRDVLNLVHELEAKGAALTVLEPAFSTKDAAGSILVTVLGMVAEMERRFIRERQQAGIEAAKAKGVYKGRKPSVPVEKVRAMRKAGHGPTAIAEALGISRMSVHRVLSGQE